MSPDDARAWVLGAPARLVTVSETDRHGRALRTVLNLDTGLVRNDPVPGDDDLARFYAEDYRTAYKGTARPRPRQILRNFRRVAEHVRRFRDVLDPRARVLDVGAGSGEFVFLAAALGKDARGIEPNRPYAAYCREDLGLDVAEAPLAAELFAPGSFDLVRLNHVLEHLNDPPRYLSMIARWLAPGGVLYVEVPDIEDYARTKSRGAMFHYGHVFNFNAWTLRAVAGLVGLTEAPETAERSAGTTGVFFRPAEPVAPDPAEGRANAVRVRAALAAHEAGVAAPAGQKARKPFVKLLARAEETWTGWRAGSPRAIGEATARGL